MATYVPGVPSYMPDWKPFTPDYKFLSDVLDVKTNKYNTNYKAINDLYSQVVYADLQRKDTKSLRDQYADGLGKQLQRISGMDLSVMQNADAAKAIFRPFYEEDIIVQDMLHTKNIRKQMQYADDLKKSLDPQQHAMYWSDGVEYLNWKNEDFKNASQEKALNMPLPKYIPDADLYNKAITYLEAKGYDVTLPSESPDGKWIIHDTNGGVISKQALADVTAALGSDSMVREAYYANAYVQSRRFADKAMKEGKVANVNDGITLWSQEKLQTATEEMGVKVSTINRMLEGMDIKKVQWEKLEKKINIVPGSREDMAKRQFESDHEALKKTAKNYEKSIKDAQDLLKSTDYENMHNQAYNVLMANNITSDLTNAAFNYSERTKKRTIEPNIYKVNEIKYQQNRALKRLDHEYKVKEMIIKDQLENAGKNALSDMLGLGDADPPSNAITSGTPMANAYADLEKREKMQMSEEANILSKIYQKSATGDGNSVKIEGKWKGTGVIYSEDGGYSTINRANLSNVLKDPNNHQLLLEAIGKEYEKMNSDKVLDYYPYASEDDSSFNADKVMLEGALLRRNALDNSEKQFHNVMYETNEIIISEDAAALQKLSTQKKWEKLTDEEKYRWSEGEGMKRGKEKFIAWQTNWFSNPAINKPEVQGFDPLQYLFHVDEEINPTKRTKKEFLNFFVENPNLMNKVREDITSSKYFRHLLGRDTDDAEVLEALSDVYDGRNELINRAMTGEFNIPYDPLAGLEPGQKIPNRYPQFNLTESLWGISPKEQQSGDLAVYPTYGGLIAPLGSTKSSLVLFKNFIQQLTNDPDVIIGVGGLDNVSTMTNTNARLVWDQYRIALDVSIKEENSSATALIKYNPNIDGEKAGYTLTFQNDWWNKMKDGAKIKEILAQIDGTPSISITFPQRNDVNERSVDKQRFSTVRSLANYKNGYNHINNVDNGGSIHLYKVDNNYWLQMIMKQYGIDSKGKRGYYNIKQPPPKNLGIAPGIPEDELYRNYRKLLLDKAKNNAALRQKYNTYNK